MKHMGMGFKGMGAKGAMAKGFGFIGGIFKLLFFGFFLIIFLVIAFIFIFAMKKKTKNFDNFESRYTKKDNDEIIDAEIIETHPIKR